MVRGEILIRVLLFLAVEGAILHKAAGGTLSGTFATVPEGSIVDLTAEGKVDWVHWGLYTESSLNRKSEVVPQISDFKLVYDLENTNAYAFVYPYADNFNGYSWNDGYPEASVTNTTTGVWAYGIPAIGSGFEISAPADTSTRILKVYVGAYAALGHFEASLSDGSAPAYNNATLMNLRNGPGRVYTLEYSANSAGQKIIVRWTLASLRDATANVTLQSAALSAQEANNPPVVAVTAPGDNSKFSVGMSIGLTANAYDADGSITLVEFYDGLNKIGDDSISPYTATWSGASAGLHRLTARATDNGGASRSSVAVEVFLHSSGGALTGSMTAPPYFVDLTTEGTADWAHWGLLTPPAFDHKRLTPQIRNIALMGDRSATPYTNEIDHPIYAWTDGTPTATSSGTPTGIYVNGFTNGFQFTVPADTTIRQLKVYVSLYGARGNFQAWLSDSSARAYTDTSLDNVFGDSYAAYTIGYAAATAGQTLNVRYRSRGVYDMDYGNVALQSVTLQGPAGPRVIEILNPARLSDMIGFSIDTEPGKTYTVEYTPSFSPADWQVLTNFPGDGMRATITDGPATIGQRFYRVKAQ